MTIVGLLGIKTESWKENALCANYPNKDMWWPAGGSAASVTAKRICSHCPVNTQCLESALTNNEPCGIWGGFSRRERDELKRGRRTTSTIRVRCANGHDLAAADSTNLDGRCKQCHRDRVKAYDRRTKTGRTGKGLHCDHGTAGRYCAGCRCQPCTEAQAIRNKAWYDKRRRERLEAADKRFRAEVERRKNGTVLPPMGAQEGRR